MLKRGCFLYCALIQFSLSPQPQDVGSVCVCVCVRMITCKAQALQRTPLYVTGAGKYRDTHQRPVLTLPAWKLFSDKSPGSSKGGNGRLDWGRGHPLGRGGLVTDRQACGRTRGTGFSSLTF